ncbi:hypothetical protein [Hydrogenophaga sp. 5NK40-0174]|uniref:hypothetical protein n=1 Tax=Hydrogenophaga sp. 5NK40-0174 TaxID=3127649 RepID=UPI0031033238
MNKKRSQCDNCAPRTLAVPAVVLTGAVAAVAAGFRADSYLEHVHNVPPPHPYPFGAVLWVLAFMAVEGMAVFAILRPCSYSYSWGRSLTALLLSAGCFVIGLLGSMHAPPPWSIFVLWQIATLVAMLLLFLSSAAGAVARSWRQGA